MYISRKVEIKKDGKGNIYDCDHASESDYGAYFNCQITNKMCAIDGGECPFEKENIVQIEYKAGA